MPEPTKPAAQDQAANKDPKTSQGASAQAPQPGVAGKQGEQDPKMVPLSALHESREQTRQVKEELDKMKEVLTNVQRSFGLQQHTPPSPGPSYGEPAYNPNYNPGYGYNNPVSSSAQQDALWEENPRLAMQRELHMALNYYDQTQAEVDSQMEEAARKHTDFEQYRATVQRFVRMVRPDQRRNPGTVETAYFLAKGQNSDAIKQAAIDEMINKMKSGEKIQGLEGTSAGSQSPPSALKPTDEQLRAADAMGVPIEEYLKFVKK